jgi:hypothetical protein
MGSVALDHVAVPEHPVILPWAFVLPAEGVEIVCTCPRWVTRFRESQLEPIVDPASPSRARSRSSPRCSSISNTLPGLSRFPSNFQMGHVGHRVITWGTSRPSRCRAAPVCQRPRQKLPLSWSLTAPYAVFWARRHTSASTPPSPAPWLSLALQPGHRVHWLRGLRPKTPVGGHSWVPVR